MQGPSKIYKGKTIAQHYKEIGVNTFFGLWQWPYDYSAGYTELVARSLQDQGLVAYAGDNLVPDGASMSAIDWNAAHPEFRSTIIGYLLGDEPDMKRKSSIPEEVTMGDPDVWQAKGNLIRSLDPSRQIYGAFGKGFALDPWDGYDPDAGDTKEGDFAQYVSPTNVISSDYYGITEPWTDKREHGIWTYGRAVANTLVYAGGRPTLGVLEASAPWKDSAHDGTGALYRMYRKMPPRFIKPIVWNMMISGASGYLYFCHDFSDEGPCDYAALVEPGMADAIREANESVQKYAPQLLVGATRDWTWTTTDGSVDVITLTKSYHGRTYIFAMGNGNGDFIEGQAVNARIYCSKLGRDSLVQVLGEERNVRSPDGRSFTDRFEPYEVHIYKF